MFLSAVYIRFFRSFNFDYLRKAHSDFQPSVWDALEPGGLQYPYVKVPIEDTITTVVGANESGKSQLLSAIKIALTGEGIRRGDFCRYSQFFAVNKDMALPEFGLEFKDLSSDDRQALIEACTTLPGDDDFTSFALFRPGNGSLVIYVPRADTWERHELDVPDTLASVLPAWFEIDAEVALPPSVPLSHLAQRSAGSLRTSPRRSRQRFLNTLFDEGPSWFSSPDAMTAAGPSIVSAYSSASTDDTQHLAELSLVDDLLLKVAGIDRSAFQELLAAVDEGRDGYANGIVEQMNKQLATSLNFPNWWSQDHQFQLLLTLRDQDLVFTIRDRTGTEYSADERSGGLKYFLSYFVQYLAHEPPSSGAPEILLMDEPDAYLSSSGQQDLLRIFENFALPQDPERPRCQVVYVTHSPFLINKNHGERIRVLEKGEGDEGTRVVRNVSRNHYEPLRSAFGGFVGETTFISNCNLMLEGMSDQILLAGMSARLRELRTPNVHNLDLNTVTLVPAGSASHIPYLVYLARGRDEDRPAVIVLLDSDQSGNDARKELKRGHQGKQLIAPDLVLQLGVLQHNEVTSSTPPGVEAIEDLIPLEIGVAAVKRYAQDFLAVDEREHLKALTVSDIDISKYSGTHDALATAAQTKVPGLRIDKVGLARSVMHVIQHDPSLASAAGVMDGNFRTLFRELSSRQRKAQREITQEKTAAKIKRLKRSFLLDHPISATRAEATILLEDIDAVLDNSVDADDFRSAIRDIRRAFTLDDDPHESVTDYQKFQTALQSLVYRQANRAQDT
jgi:predicted ATP-dependent endonuclease of OLD family